MSAYVVDRNHVAFMVDAAMSMHIGRDSHAGGLSWCWDLEGGDYSRAVLQVSDWKRAAEVGQMLWDENVKSVRHRYPDCAGDDLPGCIADAEEGFQYGDHTRSLKHKLEPVAVLKALSGFEYQSCEHPEWRKSQAQAFCDALRCRAIHLLPGYDDAEWEVTD